MTNPFEAIEARLSNIETLLLDIKHAPKEQSESDQLMILDDACKFLNKSKPTLYRYVSDRSIPFHKSGNRIYFLKSELIEWITENQ